MTKEEILELYKKEFGRKWRTDQPIENCITKLEEKTGREIVLNTEGEIPPGEDPGEDPPPAASPIEVVKEGKLPDPSRGTGRTRQYRVFFKGNELYWTKAVIDSALKSTATRDLVEFPENTDYVASAEINKCKNC